MPKKTYDCMTKTGRKQLTEDDIYNLALPIIRGMLSKRYPRYRQDFEDITQEVMLTIYQAMNGYRGGEIEAFFFGIASKAISKIVTKRLKRRYEHELLTFDPETLDNAPDAPREAGQEGFEETLADFETQLTKREKRALEMRLDGATNTQIYNALHPRAKKKYIGQAMVQFWKRIGQKYEKWRITRE